MTYKEKVERIEAMRLRLWKELEALREECPHDNKAGEYKSDTGNLCEYDDSYWIQGVCLDCGKRFHIDSKKDPQGYKTFFDNATKVVIK